MAGYSGTPLLRKLGIREGQRALLLGLPHTLIEIVDFRDFALRECRMPEEDQRRFDYVHVFETERAALEAMVGRLMANLMPDGIVWISWPKKASKVPTTITEDALRDIFLPTGLVDVKVAAIDETWSGLKFVIRKELRAAL